MLSLATALRGPHIHPFVPEHRACCGRGGDDGGWSADATAAIGWPKGGVAGGMEKPVAPNEPNGKSL